MLLCLLPATAIAQYYVADNYTTRNGLPHSNVFRIYQDKKGFLWFCTSYGLSRFDGKNFYNIYDTDGLSGNTMMSMTEDDKESKYIGIYGRRLSVIKDNVAGIYANEALPPSILNQVYFGNRVWLVCKVKMQHLYSLGDKGLTRVVIKDKDNNEVQVNKVVVADSHLYIATDNGVYTLNEKEQIVPLFHQYIHQKVWDLQVDKDGHHWLGLTDGIVCVDHKGIIARYDIGDDDGTGDMLITKSGRLLVAVPNHGIFTVADNRLVNITRLLRVTNIIINDLFEDNQGNIWIATHGMGIYKIASLHTMYYPVEENKLNNYCHVLCPIDSNKMLVGSIGTVSLWEDGVLHALPPSKSINSTHYIYFIYHTNDSLYMGTPYGLVVKKDYRQPQDYFLPEKQKPGCISYCKDSKGRVWFGGFSDLYNLYGNELVLNEQDPVLRGKRFFSIYEDRAGNIWFGTRTGLIKYDNRNYSYYTLGSSTKTNRINDITEDEYQRLWMATDSGLVYLDAGGYHTITAKHGLNHNSCRSLAEDTVKKVLWVGTLYGICSVDLATLEVKEYPLDIREEIPSLYFDNRTNQLFVGAINGLYVLEAKDADFNIDPPPVYITAALYGGQRVDWPSGLDLDRPGKLVLSFTGISYSSPYKMEYRYKLQGIDEHWIYTTNNTLELSALPSGSFKFLLSARQNKGAWSDTIILPVHVLTPFYRTWWFICIAILALSAMIFWMTRWFITRKEAAKRRQLSIYNKMTYLKQQALTALINPHFIFNCMTSIQHYLHRNATDKASSFLADFASLIRLTMDDAQNSFINLKKELDRIGLYLQLEQFRFDNDLSYRITTDPALNIGNIWIPNMILQPYVENAIWHGIMPKEDKGHIDIRIERHGDDYIRISIEDDGIGISESKKRKKFDRDSYGMSLTEERMKLLKQLLHKYYTISINEIVHNGTPSGTLIEIILPEKDMHTDFMKIEAEIKNM